MVWTAAMAQATAIEVRKLVRPMPLLSWPEPAPPLTLPPSESDMLATESDPGGKDIGVGVETDPREGV